MINDKDGRKQLIEDYELKKQQILQEQLNLRVK